MPTQAKGERAGWWTRLKAFLVWLVARLLAHSLRLEVRGGERLADLRRHGPVIFAFWHGRQFVLFRANPDQRLATITSHSRDGALQAEICRRFGLHVVRGSSSRGGLAGMLSLRRTLRAGYSVALAVDGPRGPAEEAKAGAAALALTTGTPLVPVAAAASKKLVLRRSWDAFEIPAPFTRARVWFGEPLQIPPGKNHAATRERLRTELTSRLKEMNAELDRQISSWPACRLYTILAHLALLLGLPFLLLFRRRLRPGLGERLGLRTPPKRSGARPTVWFHAASAGDMLALEPIMQELRQARPDLSLVATTVTDSGWRLAKRFGWLEAVRYAPFDLPWAVRSLVKSFSPQVLVLQQAEIWPVLLREVKKASARIVLVNGRFSEKRLTAYRLLFHLTGNPLPHLDVLCMRDQKEAERALALGAKRTAVRISGDSKFDALSGEPPDREHLQELRRALGLSASDTIWLAGSIHGGEDKILLDAFLRLHKRHHALKLVIAPRYLERAAAIVRLAAHRGLPAARRNQQVNGEKVVVLDSMGELRDAYWLADLVFVGGSLVRRGGHNLLEPAVCGKPVLFGPHVENFLAAVEALSGHGGFQVGNADELEEVAHRLLEEPEERRHQGQMARQAILARRGAARYCSAVIQEQLTRKAQHAD